MASGRRRHGGGGQLAFVFDTSDTATVGEDVDDEPLRRGAVGAPAPLPALRPRADQRPGVVVHAGWGADRNGGHHSVMTTFRPVAPKSHCIHPQRTLPAHGGHQLLPQYSTCTGRPSWTAHSPLLSDERMEHRSSPSRQSTGSADVKHVSNDITSGCSHDHRKDMIWLPRLSSTVTGQPTQEHPIKNGQTTPRNKSNCNAGRLPRPLNPCDGTRPGHQPVTSVRAGLSPIMSSGDTEIVSETSSTSGSFTIDGIRHTHGV